MSAERLRAMFAEAAGGTALGRSLLIILNTVRSSAPSETVGRTSEGMQSAAVIRAVGALESVVASGNFDERLAARDTLDHWSKARRLVDGL
jgi:hypothetical protein